MERPVTFILNSVSLLSLFDLLKSRRPSDIKYARIALRGNEPKGPSPSRPAMQVEQKHYGSGDNVAGNKTIQNDNVTTDSRDIPLWLRYTVALLAIVSFIWLIYTYFFPN